MSEPWFDAASTDAKIIAGTMFGAKTSVTFQMRESRPTPRAQAALDELMAAGALLGTREGHDKKAITYRPTQSLLFAFQWVAANLDDLGDAMNFPVTEKVP